MSLHLVPHLPRLAQSSLMCDRKVRNLFHYLLVILFFINNHGNEHKMPKNNPLLNVLLIFLCVEEMWANLFFAMYNFIYLNSIFINNRSK